MNGWRSLLVRPEVTIRETIRRIDEAGMQIALVTDGADRLLGSVTDGDVRRGILRGVDLQAPVSTIMNPHPVKISAGDDRLTAFAMMRKMRLRQIAVVDDAGHLIGVEFLDEILEGKRHDNPVVLMAGGEGRRLRPLTEECPKPMLPVGGRPILETIMLNFLEYGFHRFFFSVNYKAEIIEQHFGDGSRWGVQIEYLRESEQLGTAGALGLIPQLPPTSVIVMNGDLLTKVNFDRVLDFHVEHRAAATMGVREYHIQVPFGVTRLDGHQILEIEEKPVQKFFVNAGIYVLESEVINEIRRGIRIDMPSIFSDLVARGRTTVAFPIREYWLDVGRMADYERAQGDFGQI